MSKADRRRAMARDRATLQSSRPDDWSIGPVSAAAMDAERRQRVPPPGGIEHAPALSDTATCGYCIGSFVPTRSDQECCSRDCKQHRLRALVPDYEIPSFRRDGWSDDREAACGRGALSARELDRLDLRVRTEAGLEPDLTDEDRAVTAKIAAQPTNVVCIRLPPGQTGEPRWVELPPARAGGSRG